jgi:hypothetical protein
VSLALVICQECKHYRPYAQWMVRADSAPPPAPSVCIYGDGSHGECMATMRATGPPFRDPESGKLSLGSMEASTCREAHRPSLIAWVTRRGLSCKRFRPKTEEMAQ